MLNEHWLRSFRAIAEVGSFTRAAGQLQLTQAAVSQHVRHLEQQLGALFLRRPRFIELTPAGMALLQYCQEMDSADRRLQAKLASADSDQGEFALITPGSVGLARVHPRFHGHLQEGRSRP
jgi:DNA-binding transcriptional LysR family regulator